nr:acyl-CoA dehydrogenase family protein [Croceicoccus pelagius]
MSENSSFNIAERVEHFVRSIVTPYEADDRRTAHGPQEELVHELRAKAREAGLFNPHISAGGEALCHREMVPILRASGLSPLGPLALNTAAPDEGNVHLLSKIATGSQRVRFLEPLLAGKRSAFLMSEPASEGGAGSDPTMLKTIAHRHNDTWVINGRKAFITGFAGAEAAILMARTDRGDGKMAATMFLVKLPNSAIHIDRVPVTIDNSMPGGHATLTITNLIVSDEDILGAPHEGFAYAQLRLAPARLTHCMRWLGAATRAHEIATEYAVGRRAFGKSLIEHEGVGFMLADNRIALKQSELMIGWCADLLDTGEKASIESSMVKVAVSEALFSVADRCVQIMGGTGVSADTVVEQIFREIRAFRIYDGPTEVHKWSIARQIARESERP